MRRIGAVFGVVLLAAGANTALAQGDGSATLAGATGAKAAVPVVMNVRIGEHPDSTRFVIELSDPVKLRVFTLANPNRVVI
ncbi:MAG TPA: AMIN domain-containing protein, partial [Rhizomicrobium sp.]